MKKVVKETELGVVSATTVATSKVGYVVLVSPFLTFVWLLVEKSLGVWGTVNLRNPQESNGYEWRNLRAMLNNYIDDNWRVRYFLTLLEAAQYLEKEGLL